MKQFMRTDHDSVTKALERFAKMEMYSIPLPPPLPTAEERNYFSSAQVLVERMSRRYDGWTKEFPDGQPVILAMVPGALIQVSDMRAESHNAVALTGNVLMGEGDPKPCMLMVHQNSLQLLCYIEKLVEPETRKLIGFHWD